MMKKLLRQALALVLTGALLLAPALAAGEGSPAPAAPWAYDGLCEAEALNLLTAEDMSLLWEPVSQEKLDAMLSTVQGHLSLLGLPAAQPGGEALVLDLTRGGVINALYQELAAYELEGVPAGAVDCMRALGVLRGDEHGSLLLDQPCTLQEALLFCQRLVTSVCDRLNAGSLGLLWKASGNGNTLYLLGTIHVDRGNVYPLHRQLRDALLSSQGLFLEIDFGDTEGLQAFALMQTYTDGTGLKDHISAELYRQVVDALAPLGMSEEAVSQYKAWALANTFSTLGSMDESTGDAPMVIDSYIYSKALMNGIPVSGVESYQYQAEMFDSLDDSYQEEYLAANLKEYLQGDDGEGVQLISEMLEAWKARDAALFDELYVKDDLVATGDELLVKLFEERDPHMIAAADQLLKSEGENTFFLAVGAGHMTGAGGIVQGLRDLGYTVELMPAA